MEAAPLASQRSPQSHHRGTRRHNGWQCVRLRALLPALLLNIIRMANMTDDEGDRAAKPQSRRDPFLMSEREKKISSYFFFFYPFHKANFCSSIKLSVVSVAPRSGSKIRSGGGARKEGVGLGGALDLTVGECEPMVPFTLCLGGNGNTTILQ